MRVLRKLSTNAWQFIKSNAEALIVIELALALIGGFWGWVEFGFYMDDRRLQREVSAYEFLSSQTAPTTAKSWALQYIKDSGGDLTYMHFPQGTFFKNVDLSGADLTGFSCRKCKLQGVRFDKTTLHDADFTDSELTDVSIIKAKITSVNFKHSDFNNVDFDGSTLKETVFNYFGYSSISTQFTNTSFKDTDLSNARFEGSNFKNTDFSNAIMEGTTFKGGYVTNTNITQKQMDSAYCEHVRNLAEGLECTQTKKP